MTTSVKLAIYKSRPIQIRNTLSTICINSANGRLFEACQKDHKRHIVWSGSNSRFICTKIYCTNFGKIYYGI